MAEEIKKQFWQSTNFWTAVTLLVGGFFVGFPADVATNVVGWIFMLIGAGATLRNFFQDSPTDVKGWVLDANFWNYLTAIVVAIVPTLPSGTIELIESVARDLIGGNWQGAIIGVVSLVTILYKIFSAPKEETPQGEAIAPAA